MSINFHCSILYCTCMSHAFYMPCMLHICMHISYMRFACMLHAYNIQYALYMHLACILYIANRSRWKSCVVIMDQLVPQNFSSEIACAIGLAMQDYHPTANVFQQFKSLVLQLRNFSTSNNLQYTVQHCYTMHA